MRLRALIWTYVTFTAVLGSTLIVPLAYVDFELRKQYISEVLCINREKPERECHGKCYLKKRLVEAGKGQSTNSHKLSERFQLSFFKQVVKVSVCMPQSKETRAFNNGYLQQDIRSLFIKDIFHPPELSPSC